MQRGICRGNKYNKLQLVMLQQCHYLTAGRAASSLLHDAGAMHCRAAFAPHLTWLSCIADYRTMVLGCEFRGLMLRSTPAILPLRVVVPFCAGCAEPTSDTVLPSTPS